MDIDPAYRAAALLHDAHEAIDGVGDVSSPVKSVFMAPAYYTKVKRINKAIAKALGFDVRVAILMDTGFVGGCDMAARRIEARNLMVYGRHFKVSSEEQDHFEFIRSLSMNAAET